MLSVVWKVSASSGRRSRRGPPTNRSTPKSCAEVVEQPRDPCARIAASWSGVGGRCARVQPVDRRAAPRRPRRSRAPATRRWAALGSTTERLEWASWAIVRHDELQDDDALAAAVDGGPARRSPARRPRSARRRRPAGPGAGRAGRRARRCRSPPGPRRGAGRGRGAARSRRGRPRAPRRGAGTRPCCRWRRAPQTRPSRIAGSYGGVVQQLERRGGLDVVVDDVDQRARPVADLAHDERRRHRRARRRRRSRRRGAGGRPSSPRPRAGAPSSPPSDGIRRNSTSSSTQPARRSSTRRSKAAKSVGAATVAGARRRRRSCALAVEVEERQLHDGRADAAAPALDRPLHLRASCPTRSCRGGTDASASACLRIGLQPCEVALPTWRPSANTGTGERSTYGRDAGRQALGVVQALDVVPVELQADEPPRRAARPPAPPRARAGRRSRALSKLTRACRGRSRTGCSSARGSSRAGPRCSRPRAGSARPRAGSTSSASMPAGRMAYAWPASKIASQTSGADSAGIHSS